jgi:hypothetical protein
MHKEDQKYLDLKFFPVLSGGVCCLHRPSQRGLSLLKQSSLSAVFTLLSPSEDPHSLGEICSSLSLKWHWVALQGANKRLLEACNTSVLLKNALLYARSLLEQGEHLLIHCAAGIHRTGLFLYALLRICGFSSAATPEAIRNIRMATFKGCGQHRFELAEQLACELLDCPVASSSLDQQGFAIARKIEQPLCWIRILPTHDSALLFDCVLTDQALTQYVQGPSVALHIRYKAVLNTLGADWLSLREPSYQSHGPTLSPEKFESSLHFFLTSSSSGLLKPAGVDLSYELSFIHRYWPKISSLLQPDPLLIPLPQSSEPLSSLILSYKSL